MGSPLLYCPPSSLCHIVDRGLPGTTCVYSPNDEQEEMLLLVACVERTFARLCMCLHAGICVQPECNGEEVDADCETQTVTRENRRGEKE